MAARKSRSTVRRPAPAFSTCLYLCRNSGAHARRGGGRFIARLLGLAGPRRQGGVDGVGFIAEPQAGDAGGRHHGRRIFQPGDAMRHLAWRQIARVDAQFGGQLATKHFEGGALAELCLDLHALPPQLDLEARLSRLTRWVLEAEQRQLPYALQLGGLRFAPALGDLSRGTLRIAEIGRAHV